MKIFLDTSSLIKLYHHEISTEYLDSIFIEHKISEIFLSDLAKLEFSSAIFRKVRTGKISEEMSQTIIKAFRNDYPKFSFIKINDEIITLSMKMIDKYGTKGLRTLDSIQLASIVKLKSKLAIALTADNLLNSFISEEQIKTTL